MSYQQLSAVVIRVRGQIGSRDGAAILVRVGSEVLPGLPGTHHHRPHMIQLHLLRHNFHRRTPLGSVGATPLCSTGYWPLLGQIRFH